MNNLNSTTRDKVLSLLEENSNIYISGQDIADRLFLTRAAVWKAIKSLRNSGFQIEAVNNRGYCLVRNEEALNYDFISAAISNTNLEAIVYEEVTSTNNKALEYGQNGHEGDMVIIADYQTNGRGRRGRNFYSPKGSGLYMSFLLHPDIATSKATLLTCMSAVALCRAIKEVCNIEVSIKWVNDIFLGDKKISGILTEASTSIEDGSLSYVVVGIGINLFPPKEGFPEDISKIAGSLFESRAGHENVKNTLCAAIINKFMDLYLPFDMTFTKEYKSRSMLIGNYVKVNPSAPTKNLNGYALVKDIDEECHLVVEYENGNVEVLSSGEVSVVKY